MRAGGLGVSGADHHQMARRADLCMCANDLSTSNLNSAGPSALARSSTPQAAPTPRRQTPPRPLRNHTLRQHRTCRSGGG
eukprot:2588751-Rhodomonas_salina.1